MFETFARTYSTLLNHSVPSKALQLPTLFLPFSKYPVTLLMIIKCASRCWPAVRPHTALSEFLDCNQGTETRTSKKSKKENMATHHALDVLPAMSLFPSKIITNIAPCLHRVAYGPGPFIVFVMCHFKQTVNLFSPLLAVESAERNSSLLWIHNMRDCEHQTLNLFLKTQGEKRETTT